MTHKQICDEIYDQAQSDCAYGFDGQPRSHVDGCDELFRQVASRELVHNHMRSAAGQETWRHITRGDMFLVYQETEPKDIRKALVNAAATLVAWIADIDSREAAKKGVAA